MDGLKFDISEVDGKRHPRAVVKHGGDNCIISAALFHFHLSAPGSHCCVDEIIDIYCGGYTDGYITAGLPLRFSVAVEVEMLGLLAHFLA